MQQITQQIIVCYVMDISICAHLHACESQNL